MHAVEICRNREAFEGIRSASTAATGSVRRNLRRESATVKVAYLVLAHKNPVLIQRQIDFLSSDDTAFYIHIDAKSDIRPFLTIRRANVFFTGRRIRVTWAEYSMVEAIIVLMRQALASLRKFEYFILLSGSDYPLKRQAYISHFLDRNKGTDFISLVAIPNEHAGIPLSKIANYRVESERPLLQLATRIGAKIGVARRDYRKYLGPLVPYGGSTWWALTRESCEYVLDFVDRSNSICEFFRCTFAPDETFFHTILGNAPFRDRIRRCFMYDDWSTSRPNPAHPALIGEEQLQFFASSNRVIFGDVFGIGEMLFARKFTDDDLNTVRRIEAMMKIAETS